MKTGIVKNVIIESEVKINNIYRGCLGKCMDYQNEKRIPFCMLDIEFGSKELCWVKLCV